MANGLGGIVVCRLEILHHELMRAADGAQVLTVGEVTHPGKLCT